MWARHKEQDHKENFQKEANEKSNNKTKSTSKKVSFASVKDDEQNDNNSDQIEIKVKEELLHNAKSFLSQYTDFQTGGARGT